MGDTEKVAAALADGKTQKEKRRRNGNLEYPWSARFHT